MQACVLEANCPFEKHVLIQTEGSMDHSDSDKLSKLESFDDLFVGSPVDIENNLNKLLPEALTLKDHSIYLQILSQIALAQAMQKKFDAAHKTLNTAEGLLKPEDHLAKVRILLERGRVYMQSGDNEVARPFFLKSYELSKANNFDYHTANAAHMIAIIASTPEEKIKWNKLAIELVENSPSVRAQAWQGSLYNNLGQAYLEAKLYPQALDILKKAQKFREKEGYGPNIRVAKWAVARALRLLNQNEEALNMLLPLIKEYDAMTEAGNFDIPQEILPSIRGLVYEELAEIYAAKAAAFAKLAYDDLSQDEWFKKLETNRLERLKHLKN